MKLFISYRLHISPTGNCFLYCLKTRLVTTLYKQQYNISRERAEALEAQMVKLGAERVMTTCGSRDYYLQKTVNRKG